jgi:signal transduction histidine kinase
VRPFRLFIFIFVGLALFAARVQAQAPASPLTLTAEERAWVAAHPEVRVGFDPAWPPFSFRDSQGRMEGIDADFLSRLTQLTGLKFTPTSRDDWGQTYAAAQRHELDLLTSVHRVLEREKEFAFTEPYAHFPTAIITRNDAPFIATPRGLEGRKVAVVRGYVTAAWLREDNITVEPVEVDSIADAFLAVSQGRAYAAFSNLANASYVIQTQGLTNLKVAGVVTEVADLRFAVRRDWPELAAIVDKGLAAIPRAERQAIYDRWVRVDIPRVVKWEFVWRVGAAVLAAAGLLVWLILAHNRRLARDLTERKRLQLEIEEARDRLAVLNDEKTTLLNMVAHDLRSPLTAFLLGIDTLRWNGSLLENPSAKTTVDLMAEQVGQMRKLVDNLLDMQALEEGQRQLGREPVDLVRVVHEVIAAQRGAAGRKKIAVEWELVPTDVTVLGDAGALRQVVENILSNAVKYSRLGGGVRVALRREGAEVRCAVTDDGPGIAAADQPKLFGKFITIGTKPTGGESSHGLGLFIVRHLVTAMKGRVWCESGPGRGATFAFTVPAAE